LGDNLFKGKKNGGKKRRGACCDTAVGRVLWGRLKKRKRLLRIGVQWSDGDGKNISSCFGKTLEDIKQFEIGGDRGIN